MSSAFGTSFSLSLQTLGMDKTSKYIQTSLTLFHRLLTMCSTVFLTLQGDICDLPKILIPLSYPLCPGEERKWVWI